VRAERVIGTRNDPTISWLGQLQGITKAPPWTLSCSSTLSPSLSHRPGHFTITARTQTLEPLSSCRIQPPDRKGPCFCSPTQSGVSRLGLPMPSIGWTDSADLPWCRVYKPPKCGVLSNRVFLKIVGIVTLPITLIGPVLVVKSFLACGGFPFRYRHQTCIQRHDGCIMHEGFDMQVRTLKENFNYTHLCSNFYVAKCKVGSSTSYRPLLQAKSQLPENHFINYLRVYS